MRWLALVPIWGAFLLFGLVEQSGAQGNCGYYQKNYAAYLRQCQATDNCAMKAEMEKLVEQECGPTPQSKKGGTTALTKPSSTATKGQATKIDPVVGKSCSYFTRPTIERTEMTTTLNHHREGAHVCSDDTMYECKNGRWKSWGHCTKYTNWEDLLAERLEGTME